MDPRGFRGFRSCYLMAPIRMLRMRINYMAPINYVHLRLE